MYRFSSCLYRHKLDQSLRLLLDSNLNSIQNQVRFCGPQVLSYLLTCYTQIKIHQHDYFQALIQRLSQFDLKTVPSQTQYDIYRNLIAQKPLVPSQLLEVIEESLDLTQLSLTQLHKLESLYQLQGKAFNRPHWNDLNAELSQYLCITDSNTYTVEHFTKEPSIALLRFKNRQVLLYGLPDHASLNEISLLEEIMHKFKSKPHIIAEGQPAPKKGEHFLPDPNLSYQTILEKSLSIVDFDFELRGNQLTDYLSTSILDPELIRIRSGIAYHRQHFPNINPLATFYLMAAKIFRDHPQQAIHHLVELPETLFELDMVLRHDLLHFQNLLQVCNSLTLLEKLRYLHTYNQDLPCFKCSSDVSTLDYPIPMGYMNIIRGDTSLYANDLSNRYVLAQCKQQSIQLSSRALSQYPQKDFMIAVRKEIFKPLLLGVASNRWPTKIGLKDIIRSSQEAYKKITRDDLYLIMERYMILETVKEGNGIDYMELLVSMGLEIDPTTLEALSEKLKGYQGEIGLDPLASNLSEPDQNIFDRINGEIGDGCMMDSLIWHQPSAPTTRVSQQEQNKVLKMLKEYCH